MKNDDLRKNIARMRRNAGKKISKIKQNTGAKVAGSQFDPRKPAGAEKNMSRGELMRYHRELANFNNRKTQFVALAQGRPAPRSAFEQYKANEARERQLADAHKQRIAHIFIREYGMTVGEMAAMRPQDTRAKFDKAVHGPYSSIERDAKEIASAEGLEKLIEQQNQKFKKSYFKDKIAQGKANLIKALVEIGNYEWIETVNRLSSYQFDALWFGNPAAIESVFLTYQTMKDQTAGKTRKERWQDRVIEEEYEEFGRLLEWAENEVPRTPGKEGSTNVNPSPNKAAKSSRPRKAR